MEFIAGSVVMTKEPGSLTDRRVSEIDAIGAGQLVLRRHSAELFQNAVTGFHGDRCSVLLPEVGLPA